MNLRLQISIFCLLGLSLSFQIHAKTATVTGHDYDIRIETTPSGGRQIYIVVTNNRGQQTKHILGTVTTVPKQTRLFSWTSSENAGRWHNQGMVDSAEISVLSKGTGQRAGGGLYSSTNPLDSQQYGSDLVVFEYPQDIPIIEIPKLSQVGDRYTINGFTFGDTEWAEIHAFLRSQGVKGIRYNSIINTLTWVNVFDSSVSPRTHRVTPADLQAYFLSHKSSTAMTATKLYDILSLDQRHPLDSPLKDSSVHHILRKVLRSEPISADDKARLWAQFEGFLDGLIGINTKGKFKPSPLIRKISSLLKDEIQAHLRNRYQTYSGGVRSPDLGLGETIDRAIAVVDPGNILRTATNLGIDPHEIIAVSPTGIRPTEAVAQGFRPLETPHAVNEFGEKLLLSFEFVDFHDLLTEMAKGHTAPWTRYDTSDSGSRPTLQRWQEAIRETDLLKIYQILSQDPSGGFRSRSVGWAGGDHVINGKSYYRVTEKQKAVLEKNPFLVVEFVADGTAGYYARHQYPSAETWRNFSRYLSEDLIKRLEAAETNGQLKAQEVSGKFTQEIIKALVSRVRDLPPLLRYQALMSIHPFADFNGRSLRAYYRTLTGRALFLRNWDHDLFLSPSELLAEAALGEARLARIRHGLERAYAENPGFPDYYAQPEHWLLAAEIYSNDLALAARARRQIVEYYQRHETQEKVRKKFFDEVATGLTTELAPTCLMIHLN